VLPRKGDWTAQGLVTRFGGTEDPKMIVEKPDEGCLVFWNNRAGKIVHVEYCINDVLSIGASGGGARTKTEADAIAQNAYIKVRPFRGRSGIWGFIDPFQ
jgi:hypothetical protein